MSKNYSEAQARVDFIAPFFKALGWDVENEEGLAHHAREVAVEAVVRHRGRGPEDNRRERCHGESDGFMMSWSHIFRYARGRCRCGGAPATACPPLKLAGKRQQGRRCFLIPYPALPRWVVVSFAIVSWWRPRKKGPPIAHGFSSFGAVKASLGCFPNNLSQYSSNCSFVSEICMSVRSAVSCRSRWGMPVSIVRSCHSLARLLPCSFFGNLALSSSSTPGGKASKTYLLINFPI
jgi:hypothetical protein